MKKIVLAIALIIPSILQAQNAIDAYRVSDTQIKGTARYVSMGGAFTSLGGDPSSILQNPAGIGVYRSSEISLTLGGLWTKNTSPSTEAAKNGTLTFDNLALVTTFNTKKSKGLLSFNLGVTYNRHQSYDRTYNGVVPNLGASFTNYLETVTNGIPSTDLAVTEQKDSYYETSSPWLSILGYQSFLISPISDGSDIYEGLYNPEIGTTGSSYTTIKESGRNDEYTINFGGNINNRVYFGVALGIRDFNIAREVYYTEDLYNTQGVYVNDQNVEGGITSANYTYHTIYNMKGTGFNGKFGVIVRATDNLRIGATIHTPTYFTVDQTVDASIDNYMLVGYNAMTNLKNESANQIIPEIALNTIKIRTPWNFQVGASYVIGKKAIVSADYQYTAYNTMKMKEYNGDEYPIEKEFYKTMFKAGHTVKLGAEYRVTNALSLRAGYAIELSPIKNELKNVEAEVPTAGMQTAYMLPGNASYYSFGAGYKFRMCYLDFAYQHYTQKSDMFGYSPLFTADTSLIPGSSEVTTKQNAITFTFGLKF
ncbi:MAG: outer membrane protein transport protein [Bacteroidales bacterium]|nr:outer membrane protein transport protein [Bacteroidales bacterium]